jgi:hypothetical protein
MFSNIRIFVFAAIGIFALIILFSVVSNLVLNSDAPSAARWKEIFAKHSGAVIGTLFFSLAFPIIPSALRAFVWMQSKINHSDLALVTFIRQNECTITYVIWVIIVIFIVVMLPEIIKDMKT